MWTMFRVMWVCILTTLYLSASFWVQSSTPYPFDLTELKPYSQGMYSSQISSPLTVILASSDMKTGRMYCAVPDG